jgi:glucan biosynthesis protein C
MVPMTDKARLYYLDNLKVCLVILVIVHHVGQAYGATGWSWYYTYPGERVKQLGLFFMFNMSFFMGLFFFISGYFFPHSLDRHGPRKFSADKLVRFGIPVVFSSISILPVMEYVKYIHDTGSISFIDFYVGKWLLDAPLIVGIMGHFNIGYLWFLEHLLIYSVLFAGISTVLKRFRPSESPQLPRRVGVWAIIPAILILGGISHLMRTSWGFPIDRWIGFLGFIEMEPAHMPHYLLLFVAGIMAYRWSFLDSLIAPRNMLWLIPALGIYLITVVQIYSSGRKAGLFMWEYREALLCVGLCIGLLSLFKTFFNQTGRALQFLSENAFGAYVLHVPVVVAMQYAFAPVRAGAFTLFVVVSLLSVPTTFLASILVRRIPLVSRIL